MVVRLRLGQVPDGPLGSDGHDEADRRQDQRNTNLLAHRGALHLLYLQSVIGPLRAYRAQKGPRDELKLSILPEQFKAVSLSARANGPPSGHVPT